MKFLNVMTVALLCSPIVVFSYQETNLGTSKTPYGKTVEVTNYNANAPVQSSGTQVTPSSSSVDPSIKIDFTAPAFKVPSIFLGTPQVVKNIKDEMQRKVYTYLTIVNDAANTSSSTLKEYVMKNMLQFDKNEGVFGKYKEDEDIILAILKYKPWNTLYELDVDDGSMRDKSLGTQRVWSVYLNMLAYKILGVN
ncbi:MAG: hypothetical protein UV38_C0002G0037 [candidate division TM6 bacterium GW2011_GWE2_42_60]|nr:MAG: hypothetical protein UV38_C0002G0037 [candidate division TM6 bacterium GW2011_GWE2_42_60]HBY06206.1 hypothetical protein [Candidatus Dependentiae bacterium]